MGGGGSHVAHLNFKMSRVGVYKCLSLIVGFAITVAIWLREVVSSRCRYLVGHIACRNLPWQGLRKVFSTEYTVAMVTLHVRKMIITCLSVIGHLVPVTIVLVSADKE